MTLPTDVQTEETPESAVANLAVIAGMLISSGAIQLAQLQCFVESVTVLAMHAGVGDELKAFDHPMTRGPVAHAQKYFERQSLRPRG